MRRRSAMLLLACGLAAPASAQTVLWYTFDPLVTPSTRVDPVRLEVAVKGSPSRVTLDLASGATVDLRDDGTGGDDRGGDGVFTAGVPMSSITGIMQADDVQRVFVGYLNLFAGSTNVFQGNMFADVYTPDIGTAAITPLAADVQATSHLVNIVDPAYGTDSNVKRIAQTFYQYFDDSYDFLNVISTPTTFANRFHVVVRNDVDGLGAARSDLSAQYGSGGGLRGYSAFPVPGFFDGANTGYVHETGHQWINHLSFGPFAIGVPHWPVSTMATGTMGFSIGSSGGEGGPFPCNVVVQNGTVSLLAVTTEPVFNDFDLYLMGLLAPGDVAPQLVFPGVISPPHCGGQIYTGVTTPVTVNTIIAGAGNRVPDVSGSPKHFHAATILVSRDGLVSQETMWLYSWLASRAELQTTTPIHEGFVKGIGNPFFVSTRGLATLDTLLTSAPDFKLVAAQGAATVQRGTSATFHISAMPTRASFDGAVTFSCGTLPAQFTCAFAPAQVTPGTAGADVTLTVTTGGTPTVANTLGGVIGLTVCLLLGRRRMTRALAVAATCMAIACGGGGSPSTSSTPPSTPPGQGPATYTITVTGTSGALSHTTTLTLTVQ